MAEIEASTRHATRIFLDSLAGGFPVTGAMLFGSRARNAHLPTSDADVAVFLKGEPGAFAETKLAMADIAFDVLLETGILIQPLPVWEEQWQHPERHSNPALLENLLKEGIRL